MLSIPLIGIILIVVLTILYFILKRKPIEIEEGPELFIMFNDPLFIEPHELVDLVSILASGVEHSPTRVLYLHGDLDATPKIPIDKYFSMYDYKCVVTKTELVNKDTFRVFLSFTKNHNYTNDDINRPLNK